MKELVAWNETLQYIEQHLEEDIDMEQVSRLSNCPAGLFGRIFSILSGMPLGEYIRLRRLSNAAVDLAKHHKKVIDVAMTYGYDSVDAFSAAFRRYHQHSPSEVRRGAPFEIMTPLHFTLSIKGGNQMEVKIVQKQAFKVAGISMQGYAGAPFHEKWEELFRQWDEQDLIKLGSGQSFGSCYDMQQDQSFRYMAGFDVVDEQKARALGLEILEVPAAQYAILTLVGPMPRSIHEGWQYMMGTFFPEQGYQHAGTPDFEVYHEGDMSAADYTMELWVPIVPSK